jgi:DNA invertase Pin-like site-specific DNA recombinase
VRLGIYARTSTSNGNGDSLAAQVETCTAWADGRGFEIIGVYRDDSLSGGLAVDGRPGLTGVLLALEDRLIDAMVVHRLDRLARELHVQEAALSRAWGIGQHVQVFEAVEGEVKRDDPTDPHRRFLRQVVGAAAELERGLIKARLHGGRRRKAERAGYIGGTRLHPRYGFSLVHGEYEAVPDQQLIIDRMVNARRRGDTYGAIARALEHDGVPGPSSTHWYPMTIRRILVAREREMNAGRCGLV